MKHVPRLKRSYNTHFVRAPNLLNLLHPCVLLCWNVKCTFDDLGNLSNSQTCRAFQDRIAQATVFLSLSLFEAPLLTFSTLVKFRTIMPRFATSQLSQVESVDGLSNRCGGESLFCRTAMQSPLGTIGSTHYNTSARRFQQNCSMFRKDLKDNNPMMDIWTESKSATQEDLTRNTDLPEEELCSRLKAMSALCNVGLSPDPPQLR